VYLFISSSSIVEDGVDLGTTITGDITGFLADAGEGAVSVVGGFTLMDAADNTNYSFGSFVWGEQSYLTAQEVNNFTTGGMLVTGTSKASELSLFRAGGVANSTSVTEPFFVNRDFSSDDFSDPLDINTETVLKLEQYTGAVNDSGSVVAGDSTIYWGSWNAMVERNHDTFLSYYQNSYWFLADVTEVELPSTGNFRYNSLLHYQGEYNTTTDDGVGTTSNFSLSSLDMSFDVHFDTGAIDNGSLNVTTSADVDWDVSFSGTLNGPSAPHGPFLSMTADGGTLTDTSSTPLTLDGNVTGYIDGYFVGDTVLEAIALGFTLVSEEDTGSGIVDHALTGTAVLDADGIDLDEVALSLPESSVSALNIGWGTWDNPIEDNWVVVGEAAGDQVRLEAGDHYANVTPTPVANLQGTASYASSAASTFIGSGNAGDVTQVVAGMSVDFDTGYISDGQLIVEVGDSQAWDINFNGTVAGGVVDLDALGGTLSDPGGILSSSINADLGGVFTGDNAEAFIGGFDLIDEVNQLNHVEGIYTIEK